MIKISASTDAIDAAVISKDEAVVRYAQKSNISLRDIAAIGDGINDLPFLELEDLLLVGCPKNSQERVKRIVGGKSNGFITTKPYLEGFLEFYERAVELGAKVVVSDRDGVLLSPSGELNNTIIGGLLRSVGIRKRPMLKILTGSSYEQNVAILKGSVIPEVAGQNPELSRDPYLILAENGSLAINVISLNPRVELDAISHQSTLKVLQGVFLTELLRDLGGSVLGQFGLKFSNNPNDQANKVYLPRKATMITVDVPRECFGDANFRMNPKSDQFRAAVVDAMKRCATSSGLRYQLI